MGTNGEQPHLGHFDTDEAAAKAYDMYVEVHRPELPLNFPREGQPAAHGRSRRRSSAQIEAAEDAAAKQDYATQYIGVYWDRSRRGWRAQGPADPANGKKQLHLGYFDTDEGRHPPSAVCQSDV